MQRDMQSRRLETFEKIDIGWPVLLLPNAPVPTPRPVVSGLLPIIFTVS